MAANSWSINIVQGNPCTFEPDVYVPPGTPKPTALNAETNDSISWNNQTDEDHRIYTTEQDGTEVHLTGLIPKYGSSNAFSPQNAETIVYYCCMHPDEKGTIEVTA